MKEEDGTQSSYLKADADPASLKESDISDWYFKDVAENKDLSYAVLVFNDKTDTGIFVKDGKFYTGKTLLDGISLKKKEDGSYEVPGNQPSFEVTDQKQIVPVETDKTPEETTAPVPEEAQKPETKQDTEKVTLPESTQAPEKDITESAETETTTFDLSGLGQQADSAALSDSMLATSLRVNSEGILGVDVSVWNGDIDWNRAYQDGVRFAMIRVGYRGYSDEGPIRADTYAVNNLTKAKQAGMRVGAYFFSQAVNTGEAVEEANFALEQVKGYQIDLPIIMDIEYDRDKVGRLYNANLSADAQTEIAAAFCNTINSHGYSSGVYASKYFLEGKMNAGTISSMANNYIWLAHWTSETNYSGDYFMWQYSSNGQPSGFNSRTDLDRIYNLYGTYDIGLTHMSDGRYGYFRNGEVDTSYSGLALYLSNNKYFYVNEGYLDWGWTGITNYYQTYYAVIRGEVAWSYTGLLQDQDGSFKYVSNGKWDQSYNGLTNYNGSWYYVKGDGVLDWTYTGLCAHNGGWYYV